MTIRAQNTDLAGHKQDLALTFVVRYMRVYSRVRCGGSGTILVPCIGISYARHRQIADAVVYGALSGTFDTSARMDILSGSDLV